MQVGWENGKHPKSKLLQDERDKYLRSRTARFYVNGCFCRIQMLLITINKQGLSDMIKANYYKMNAANIIEQKRMNYKAIGILIEWNLA